MSENVGKNENTNVKTTGKTLDYYSAPQYMPGYMAMNADDIKRLVKAALPDAAIELTDLAGDGDHYSITVTSAGFKGKTRIEQHRMVMGALGGDMVGGKLHALQVMTKIT